MTVARSQLVDVNVTPWYHVISQTVRGAFLLREERKKWLETRLEELACIFVIDVSGRVFIESHLHLLLRLSPERTETWSEEEEVVVRRWGRLFPWVQQKLADAAFVQKPRRRLADLGWFMSVSRSPWRVWLIAQIERPAASDWRCRVHV